MSHLAPLGRRAFACSVLSIMFGLSTQLTAGQNPFKWMTGGDKNIKYQTFTEPAGRFELEFPNKDWKLLPSGSSSLAVFARNGNEGPTLFVDYVRMVDRLTPGEIEAMPEMELDKLKQLQPRGKDFKPDMLESKAGRGVLIRYARAGTEPEVAVQYSIAVGQDLFRLNATILEKQMAKYEPIVMHMIQSFKAPVGSSPKQ